MQRDCLYLQLPIELLWMLIFFCSKTYIFKKFPLVHLSYRVKNFENKRIKSIVWGHVEIKHKRKNSLQLRAPVSHLCSVWTLYMWPYSIQYLFVHLLKIFSFSRDQHLNIYIFDTYFNLLVTVGPCLNQTKLN